MARGDSGAIIIVGAGSSSASPFIAAAAASIQGFAESVLGHRLTPLELR